MADSWRARLSSYTFDVAVLPLGQGVDTGSKFVHYLDLLCTVTDWKTGTKHKISMIYSSRFSGLLQGTVEGRDDDYEITITTNSSELMQHIQWALVLPSTKVFVVAGSSINGDYPYDVTNFTLSPLGADPAVVAAEIAPPEIDADIQDDLRTAHELRRQRQARLGVMPRERDKDRGARYGASAASRFVTAVQLAAQRVREGRKPDG